MVLANTGNSMSPTESARKLCHTLSLSGSLNPAGHNCNDKGILIRAEDLQFIE